MTKISNELNAKRTNKIVVELSWIYLDFQRNTKYETV